MKIAVWRMGAGFQTERDSVVGGGRIASRTVETLVRSGHRVTIVGRLSDSSAAWARHIGAEQAADVPAGTEACVVLTGPFNAMFAALYETYKRLARFEGKVLYCWWDTALPFHAAPETVKLFREKCPVARADLERGKDWHVLSQVRRWPATPKSVGEPLGQMVPCFWELAEVADGEPMPPAKETTKAFGYFGSDRPGRLGELKRWFGHADAPPLELYGRWSDKSLVQLSRGNVRYMGPVPEWEVRARLNGYAATLHSADMAYVREDFVAQRFMENAMAGVPVAYSDRLQPQLKGLVGSTLRQPEDLALWWSRVQDPVRRRGNVLKQQAGIIGWARAHPDLPARALQRLLPA